MAPVLLSVSLSPSPAPSPLPLSSSLCPSLSLSSPPLVSPLSSLPLSPPSFLSLPPRLQPFWPMGTGIARGFLAALDSSWMIRSWCVGGAPLDVLSERSVQKHTHTCWQTAWVTCHAALTCPSVSPTCVSVRESVYRLLPQTTPENLQKNFSLFTVDPTTRYVNVNRLLITPAQVEDTHTHTHTNVFIFS